MKSLILLLLLICNASSFGAWKVDVNTSDKTRIVFQKEDEGGVDMSAILTRLKEADQLKVLEYVRFPDFSKDDDYQKKIKAALLKVAPEEANKIFNSKDLKSWSHYNELESKLGDAYAELEEFKGMKDDLAKAGYRLGEIRSEKFSYFSNSSDDKPRLFGFHPHAYLEPIIPSAKPAIDHNIFIFFKDQIEINGQNYLQFSIYPRNNKQIKIKGKWSPSLNAYVISYADVYQHNNNNWELVQKHKSGKSNTLTFNENNTQKLLIPISKLKHANTAIVVEIAGKLFHSGIETFK